MAATSSTGAAGGPAPATIVLDGRITAATARDVWREAVDTLKAHPDRPVRVDASRLEYVDDIGLALLFDLVRRREAQAGSLEFDGLAPRFARLLQGLDVQAFAEALRPRRRRGPLEELGRVAAGYVEYLRTLLTFTGESASALGATVRRRNRLHWPDLLEVATEAGANAVPIVLLVGFLMGVIIAFQSGIVARQFGATIFVVNGVGVAILRELAPLMTAIVFAGRTGAAFAAQIGTQKVNEEINAISTFGLSPVTFLVLPRLVAATIVVPLLCVLADMIGLVGAALVLTTFDISLTQFYFQLIRSVGLDDFGIGILKGAVFGLTIAAVGCERGLSTGGGASAVGLSATSAVVTSIVLVVVIDGIFAVLTS